MGITEINPVGEVVIDVGRILTLWWFEVVWVNTEVLGNSARAYGKTDYPSTENQASNISMIHCSISPLGDN
jgi:hypothetical protein